MPHKMRTIQGKKGYMVDSPDSNLPSFSLTEQDLPAIKKWEVGKKYKLTIEVEQVSISKDDYLQGEPISARFRIHKVKEESNEEDQGKKGYS